VQRDVAKVSMRQSFTTLRHNQPLLMLCASSLMFLTGWFSLQTVGAFYARNVLGDANLYIPITLLQNVGTFVAAALVPRLVERIGKKVTYMAGGAIAIVSGIGLIAAPGSVPALAIAIFGVLGFGLGAVNTLMWAIEADTVDYGEWKTGVRTEGITYAMFSFTRKMGQALGGAAAAYTIGFGGYVAAAGLNQSESAVLSIKLAAGLVPAMFIAIALVIMASYPLTEAKYREIVAAIAARRAAHAVSEAPSPSPLLQSPAPAE
jgi:glucuronide carrier protein